MTKGRHKLNFLVRPNTILVEYEKLNNMTTLTRYQSFYSSFTYIMSACTGFDEFRPITVIASQERHRQKLVTLELEIYEGRENEVYNHAAVK